MHLSDWSKPCMHSPVHSSHHVHLYFYWQRWIHHLYMMKELIKCKIKVFLCYFFMLIDLEKNLNYLIFSFLVFFWMLFFMIWFLALLFLVFLSTEKCPKFARFCRRLFVLRLVVRLVFLGEEKNKKWDLITILKEVWLKNTSAYSDV